MLVVIDTIIIHFPFSIQIQRVKRNCTYDGDEHPCRRQINNSTNKIIREKRSAVPQSTTDTLFDEEWGVIIAIFRISLTDFFLNDSSFGSV